MRGSMIIRFDIFLCWLPKPNTTLLLYPDLGPAINIGGILRANQATIMDMIIEGVL